MLDGRLYFSNHCSKMLEKLSDMQIDKVVVFKKPIMGTLFKMKEKIKDKKERYAKLAERSLGYFN